MLGPSGCAGVGSKSTTATCDGEEPTPGRTAHAPGFRPSSDDDWLGAGDLRVECDGGRCGGRQKESTGVRGRADCRGRTAWAGRAQTTTASAGDSARATAGTPPSNDPQEAESSAGDGVRRKGPPSCQRDEGVGRMSTSEKMETRAGAVVACA